MPVKKDGSRSLSRGLGSQNSITRQRGPAVAPKRSTLSTFSALRHDSGAGSLSSLPGQPVPAGRPSSTPSRRLSALPSGRPSSIPSGRLSATPSGRASTTPGRMSLTQGRIGGATASRMSTATSGRGSTTPAKQGGKNNASRLSSFKISTTPGRLSPTTGPNTSRMTSSYASQPLSSIRRTRTPLRAGRGSEKPLSTVRTPISTTTSALRRSPMGSSRRSPRKAQMNSARSTNESPVPPVPLLLCPSIAAQHITSSQANEMQLHNNQDDFNRHDIAFKLNGPYLHITLIDSSAALWAANDESGAIDVFSSVSGVKIAEIPSRKSSFFSDRTTTKPSALSATQHHVWIGYDDGSVLVYEHLCVTQVTTGRFHSAPVVAFCSMADGTTMSGSSDMVLVRWDKEEKNFEAITRITGVSESHQALFCLTPFGSNVVFCGSRSGTIIIVDCASNVQIATLRGHTARVNALIIVNELLFSASEDGDVVVWSLPSDMHDARLLQHGCKLIKRIPVQLAVRDMVSHHGSRSIWVAYVDGLIERWSANPDDDFGVEQVIREAHRTDRDSSQDYQPGYHQFEHGQNHSGKQDVLSLHCVSTVETMRVLVLGSNGVSKVWMTHRNTLEEALERSITAMNAIIHQDATEAAVWRDKANALKRREFQRKDRYCEMLSLHHKRRLLFGYYSTWRQSVASHRPFEQQHEEICLHLEARYQFRLRRRYFTLWCHFYDDEQRRFRRQLMAIALERVSQRAWAARLVSRWQFAAARMKLRRRQCTLIATLAQASGVALCTTYFAQWRHCCPSNRAKVSLEEMGKNKIPLLAARARQRSLRIAYNQWRSAVNAQDRRGHHDASPVGSTVPSALASKSLPSHEAQKEVFATAYAAVVTERFRRSLFAMWCHWHDRRRRLRSLRALATAMERRCRRGLLHRFMSFWRALLDHRRVAQLVGEVQQVEKRLREAEETHADIFDKLQLQKRLDQLRRQQEEEEEHLRAERSAAARLDAEREKMRGAVSTAEEDAAAAAALLFNPSVLRQLPPEEAAGFVMARLKGTVLNLYTDMPLFRQIRDRMRCGTNAAVVFLEGFQEVKRIIVTVTKKPVGASWRTGERWRLTPELLDTLPPHQCAAVVQAVKAMVVAYEMVGVADRESVALTREEIVVNADLLFMLWRACYAARKPLLPVNNRVAVKA